MKQRHNPDLFEKCSAVQLLAPSAWITAPGARGDAWPSAELRRDSRLAGVADVKRSMAGTYVPASKKWLQTYLWEFEYRQNLRRRPDLMFDLLLQSFPRPAAGE